MNKIIAKELNEFAQEISNRFSKFNREANYNRETFRVDEVIPTSDQTAVIKFKNLLVKQE